MKKDLSIDYLGVHCENPFFLSSSPVASNFEMISKCFDLGWGGVFFKTIGIFVADECSPRFDQTSKDGTTWLGFKNMEQISDKTPEVNFENIRKLKQKYPHKIIAASIMGRDESEWKQLAKMAEDAGADLIEGNFSCPQMTDHAMGSDVGSNPELVKIYSQSVTQSSRLPFIAKMTPNITSMIDPAKAAIDGGAKGLAAINTVKSITKIDFEHMTAMPVVNGKSSISGYSGAAIRPIALRFVAELLQNDQLKHIPVSGIGGIETWRDAVEYFLLGCKNLQVTTAVMQYGYRIIDDLISGLSYFMEEKGFHRLEDFIGMALPNIIPAEDINRDFVIYPHFDTDKCIGCGRCYISCYDGAHQAISWDEKTRKPDLLYEHCVGCHLCMNVCPIESCITSGPVSWKVGRQKQAIIVKKSID